jgi:hypothetical protein
MKQPCAKASERLFGSLVIACALVQGAMADAQGWNGPGWYVSDTAPVNTRSATPNFVLFNGPHLSQSDCVLIYDRLYSPIGLCRFLGIKPCQ